MRPSDVLLADIAAAVLDGTPVDWAAAESRTDEATRPLLEELKLVAALADLHRSLALDDRPVLLDHWGHLRLLERIGGGAFGEVYRAWDTRLDREVALKLLPADSSPAAGAAASIIHEGRLLARVRHPNVVTIYGAEQIGHRIGLWMEFVRGRNLKDIVASGRLSNAREVIRIGIDLSRAVAAVHRAGLLHRDIKAQNVMLAEDGRAVLMDFGTGRELADTDATDLAGTPLYIAPEILRGGAATARSDVYSIGVLLYHLLTGSYPVLATTVRDLRAAHDRNERSPLLTARADFSPKLARIIERATDPEPERRPESAEALASDLAALEPRSTFGRLSSAMTAAGGPRLFSIGLAIFFAAAFVGYFHWSGSQAGPEASAGRTMLAVLPFENLTGDSRQEYFSDGLTEEMVSRIGKLDSNQLGVIAAASAMHYKHRQQRVGKIGQELGVQYVLEGSVRRDGAAVRISARLIEVKSETQRWGQEYDRELGSVLTIQNEIAQAVADEIRLTLESRNATQRPQPLSPNWYQAYDLYLKGRYYWNTRTIEGLTKAIQTFQEALSKNPNDARAHAGLADSYALMSVYAGRSAELIPKARAAALRALELDERVAEGHASLALIQEHDCEWKGAEKEFRRAIELDPNYATAHHWYAEFLGFQGRFDQALAESERARRLDPLSLIIAVDRGAILILARRYDEAIAQLRAVQAVDPTFPRSNLIIGAYIQRGMFREALTEIESWRRRDPNLLWAWEAELTVLTRMGKREQAERSLKKLEQRFPGTGPGWVTPMCMAARARVRGSDDLIACLERTFQEHDCPADLKVNPSYDHLRSDPRFQDLIRRAGLLE